MASLDEIRSELPIGDIAARLTSSPDAPLVMYPRAPARMTPTTSSALSDTLSARNRVDGTSDATRRSTSAPPETEASEPPGRCTSSSTTSGRVAAITAIADGTSAASPTTPIELSRSARRPDRKIE